MPSHPHCTYVQLSFFSIINLIFVAAQLQDTFTAANAGLQTAEPVIFVNKLLVQNQLLPKTTLPLTDFCRS